MAPFLFLLLTGIDVSSVWILGEANIFSCIRCTNGANKSAHRVDLNDPECDAQKIWEFYFDQWKQQEPKNRSLRYHLVFSAVDLTRFFIVRIQDLSDSEWDVVYRIATNFICVWKRAGFIKFYGYKVDNLEEYISTEFNPPNYEDGPDDE